MQLQPRLVRLHEAPQYLGMKTTLFNALVRPGLTIIPIGKRGKAFDRLDLDRWVEDTKQQRGSHHGSSDHMERRIVWEKDAYQDSSNGVVFGILTKKRSEEEFAKALAQVPSKRRNSI